MPAAKLTPAQLPAPVPRCEKHGPMTLRPLAGQTKEQAWCGIWYDCAFPGLRCGASVLLESAELRAQLAEQAAGRALLDTLTEEP